MQGVPFIYAVCSLSPAARVEGRIWSSVGGLWAHSVCGNPSVLSAGSQGLISCRPVPWSPSPSPAWLLSWKLSSADHWSHHSSVGPGGHCWTHNPQAGLRIAPSKPCCTQRLGFVHLLVVEFKNICCYTQVNAEVKMQNILFKMPWANPSFLNFYSCSFLRALLIS